MLTVCATSGLVWEASTCPAHSHESPAPTSIYDYDTVSTLSKIIPFVLREFGLKIRASISMITTIAASFISIAIGLCSFVPNPTRDGAIICFFGLRRKVWRLGTSLF